MPTETFANLSEEKRKRIFDATVLEFAAKRFSEASINQIIKTAGISRGSFYQYFSDKEDLYLYMLTEIGKEKLVIARRAEALHPDADFFAVLDHMTKSMLDWARERPLYHQIGLLMKLDDSQFMTKLRSRSPDAYATLQMLVERDQQRGLIKPEVDANLIVETFIALSMHVMKEYYRRDVSEDLFAQKMADIRQILKEGIARDQGQESEV